jgi:release factor glutamine methyltransferase
MILWSADYLAGKGIERARLDGEHILAHALGLRRLDLYLQYDRPLTPEELDKYRPLLKRRAGREPLQYILGSQPFRELDLEVDRRVLIPRPETEVLVGVVLEWAAGRAEWTLEALDVGTGSGAIALSLAREGAFHRVVATDSSAEALEVAARNRATAGLDDRVALREGPDYLALAADERFDVIVSNPPYVSEPEREGLEPEVLDWEPGIALFAGSDGLDVVRRLVAGAPARLRGGGLFALEIGAGQAGAVAGLLEGMGGWEGITVRADLTGRERIVMATRAAAHID